MENREKKENLTTVFNDVRAHLDQMDTVRERILPLQRQTVRICSEIIKNVHRNEEADIPAKIKTALSNLETLNNLISEAPGPFPKDYIQIVKQELGEAIIFYNLIVQGKIPGPSECGIDLQDYPYACADVVGEIRRFILKCLREQNHGKAIALLDDMNEIYSHLFTLDYPNGLIPGLRKKIDVARGVLARTEADVTLSQQMNALQQALDRKK